MVAAKPKNFRFEIVSSGHKDLSMALGVALGARKVTHYEVQVGAGAGMRLRLFWGRPPREYVKRSGLGVMTLKNRLGLDGAIALVSKWLDRTDRDPEAANRVASEWDTNRDGVAIIEPDGFKLVAPGISGEKEICSVTAVWGVYGAGDSTPHQLQQHRFQHH